MAERKTSEGARIRVKIKVEKYKNRDELSRGVPEDVLERVYEEPVKPEYRQKYPLREERKED